tara:strand:+ start:109 stop:222 length:114 start_codon:yes stop_codon:yes gene_type:complete
MKLDRDNFELLCAEGTIITRDIEKEQDKISLIKKQKE